MTQAISLRIWDFLVLQSCCAAVGARQFAAAPARAIAIAIAVQAA